MNKWQNIFKQVNTLMQQAWAGNELWRFIASLAVLLMGFCLLEIFWRSINRRVRTYIEKRKLDPEVWNLSFLLPPLRLACAALLLRLAEGLLVLPPQLLQLLHIGESLLLALAIIILCFQLIAMLDRLRLALPTDLQETFPEGTLANLQSILRITVILALAVGFTYTQKAIFPEWLWEYSWWRYLLIMVVIAIVSLAARLISKFLASMTVALKESEEQARMRLVLQAAIWPVRLILATVAVYAARGIFHLPETVDRIAGGVIAVLSTLTVVLFVYRLLDVLEFELTKYAQREDIRSRIHIESAHFGLLRTHVLRRANHLRIPSEDRLLGESLIQGLGDPEVNHLGDRLAIVQGYQHVGRLDIPVNNPALMGMLDGMADGHKQLQTFWRC